MRLKNALKIGLVIGLMTISVLISVLLISNKIKQHNKINSDVIHIYTPTLNNLNDLYSNISQSKSLIQSWINIETFNAPEKEKLNKLHSSVYPALYDTLSQLSQLNSTGWPDEKDIKLFEEINAMIQDSLFSKHRNIMNTLSSFSSYRDDYLIYEIQQQVDEDGAITLTTNEILNDITFLKKKFELLINNSGNKIISTYDSLNKFILIIGIVLTILAVFFSVLLLRSLNVPLTKTKDTIHLIGKGILPEEKLKESNDEIGRIAKEINSLVRGLKSILNFSLDIGKGNFNYEFKPLSDKDALGNSLLEMRNELIKASEEDKKRKEEDNQRNWATQGIAVFSDILRRYGDDLDNMSFEIIRKIVTYTDSNQGGIYIVNDNDENNILLEMAACYAYDRRKQIKKTITVGEGLVGRCYQEHDKIFLTDIPEDYITITSGLGEKNPTSLLIVPLTYNDKIFGIIEIASFNIYQDYQIEFIEQVGESIAASILAVKSNIQTRQLLEKSQQQSEALKSQEEELRQNLEEMQTTQEELQKKMRENEKMQVEIEKEKALMDVLLENAKESIYFKDKESKFIKASKSMADLFKVKNIEEIYGKSDFDFFKEEHAKQAYEDEQNIIKTGVAIIDKIEKEVHPNGDIKYVSTTKMPLYDKENNIIGTFGISKDITDIKNLEIEITQRNEELQAQEEELRQNLEEIQATNEQLDKARLEIEQQQKMIIGVLNEIPEKVFLKDNEGKYIIANKPVADNFGLTPEELIGKSDFDFYSEKEAASYFEREKEIINKGRAQTYEEGDVSRKDSLIVKTTKKPFKIEHLGVTGLFGVQLDITEIKKSEYEFKMLAEERERQKEELNKEKALMDTLLENATESIYFKDRESKFIKVSKSLAKLFNAKKPEELIGKSDFDFFTEEHARPAYEDEMDIIKTRKPIINKIEKETHADGRVTWVSTSKMPLIDQEDNVIGTFGISKDITDIKNMQEEIKIKNEELQATEEELRQNLEEMQAVQEELVRQKDELNKEKSLLDALLDNATESIYFKDQKSNFIKLSKSMAKLFNVKSVEELYGKSDFDFFTEEHARPAYEDEMNIIRTKKPIVNKIEKETHADGRITYVSTSKMPLYDQDRKVIGTFGISKDITELKQMEMDIKQKNEELQATEEELRQNLEEMQAVQEQLVLQKEELDKEKSLLDALLNNATESIYFKDHESKFIKLSKSMAKLFNVKNVEELYGKSDFDFFTEEHARPAYEDEMKIIKTRKPIINKIEKETHADGRIKYVSTSKMPLFDQDKNVIGTFGISKDITEIKEMEMDIKQKNEELQATEEELRQNLEEMQTIHEDLETRINENEKLKKEYEVKIKNLQEQIVTLKKDIETLKKKSGK